MTYGAGGFEGDKSIGILVKKKLPVRAALKT
jgi:hypothetical protein